MCQQPCRLRIALCHFPEVLPPLLGRPAFPVCQARVRWNIEGVGAQLRRGSRPASRVGCTSGLGQRGDESLCPGEVRDPYPPLVRLLVFEPPDPHVDEVVRGTLS